MAGWLFVILVWLIAAARNADCSSETMRHITNGFLKALDVCKQELNSTENIVGDLYHYWKQDYELLNRDTGCVILCMSKKLNLVDPSGRLHHGNTQEFALQHGAGEDVASKLVTMLHECEKQFLDVTDDCARTLEIAKCFRTDIRKLNWTPKVDVILTEVLTDI
uniref:Putative pheromone binding protein 2 n=1 Tax=Corcyra cephalonica TaxID=139036 RepID=A0A8K1P966_CORCP|nr:putative pheromone binding protein 2 [Corcyra cephalonica]